MKTIRLIHLASCLAAVLCLAAGPTTAPATSGIKAKVDRPPIQMNSARSICFVSDASSTMKMEFLKSELTHFVEVLEPTQSFNIIFTQKDKYVAMSSISMFAGTPENKKKLDPFLKPITLAEKTDPLPALELAFKQKPELIFFVANRSFADNDAVLKKVEQLHKEDPGPRIVTIPLVADEKDQAFLDLMRSIARATDGLFKPVSAGDMHTIESREH